MTTRATSNRVVCGLDDSTHAPEVLSMAASLAGRLDLWLTVLHSPSPGVFTTGEHRRELVRRGEELVARVAADYDVDEVIVQPGDPARLLTALLRDGASMAVVGSRGRGPTRAALLGSVSADLARNAPCPVVVVPTGVPARRLGDEPGILCGLDGSTSAVHALEWASRIAWATGGRLLAAHVRDPDAPRTIEDGAGALAQVEREVAGLALPVEASMHLETGDPAEQLDALARTHGADLIVIGARRQTPLRAALTGSVSGRILATAGTPVVVVPDTVELDRLWAPARVNVLA